MSAPGRYERNRLDINRRVKDEKRRLRNREANKQDEQNVKAIENSVKQVQQDFESEVKALARNISRERLRFFPFLRLTGRNGVNVEIPQVSRMDGYIQQLRNAAPTNGRVSNTLERLVTELSEARMAITGRSS